MLANFSEYLSNCLLTILSKTSSHVTDNPRFHAFANFKLEFYVQTGISGFNCNI